jgi:ribonuclease inhibitor
VVIGVKKMKKIIINCDKIKTERDFHIQMASKLDFGPYYGYNLDALWDRLSTDLERPIKIIWENSSLSQRELGDIYFKIISILEKTKIQDVDLGLDEKFDFILK